MTTGAPIYLVSACASAEEFVAAFRRYADRTGLFIPIAEPFAVAKRIWLALTLTDGGVMIEGVAEVIQSSAKPSALHGRIGMTLRFLEPDLPSKTMLAELEKARLAMKPAPCTVSPRPATIAAEPRATPPPIGGRIDAANALAECVAIGDLTGMRPEPPKAGQRFVLPSIGKPVPTTNPGVAVERGSKGSLAPLGRPKVTETQPASVVPPPKSIVPSTSPGVGAVSSSSKPGLPGLSEMAGAATLDTGIPTPTTLLDALVPPPTARAQLDGAGPAPTPSTPFDALSAADRTTDREVPAVIASAPAREDPAPRRKSMTGPPRYPTPVAPLPIVRSPAQHPPIFATLTDDPGEQTDLSNIPASADASTTVGPPPRPASASPSGGMRASEIMATVDANDDWMMTPDAPAPTVVHPSKPLVIETQNPPQGPPTGDWTMTNESGGWTAPSRLERKGAVPRQPEAPGTTPPSVPSSGNVVEPVAAEKSLAAIEDRPTAIGPTIEIDPTLMESDAPFPAPTPGTSGVMIAYPSGYPMPPGYSAPLPGTAPMVPAQPAGYPLAQGAPAYPLAPPLDPAAGWSAANWSAADGPAAAPPQPAYVAPPGRPLPGMPPPHGAMAPAAPGTMATSNARFAGGGMASPQGFAPSSAGGYGAPVSPHLPPNAPRKDLTDGGTGFFYESGQVPRYPTDANLAALAARNRRRLIVIIGSAVIIALMIVVIVMIAGGKKPAAAKRGVASGSAVAASPGSGAPQSSAVGAAPGSAVGEAPGSAVGAVPPSIDGGAAPTGTCAVEVTSVPPAAEVALGDQVIGTTPVTIDQPCGAAVKVTVRKQRYTSVTKDITPSQGGAQLAVKLSHITYAVKVTSSPAGATITFGGKVLGVTPSTIKLPAFETSTITFTKDGFAPDAERITAKKDNMAYRVTLKRGGRKLK